MKRKTRKKRLGISEICLSMRTILFPIYLMKVEWEAIIGGVVDWNSTEQRFPILVEH